MSDRWGVENANDPNVITEQILKDLSKVINPDERKLVLRNWVISIIAHAKVDESKAQYALRADHINVRRRLELIERYLDDTDPAWLLKTLRTRSDPKSDDSKRVPRYYARWDLGDEFE